MVVNFSIVLFFLFLMQLLQGASGFRYFPVHGCRGGYQWTGQDGACTGALTSFEVPVGGGYGVLAGGDLVLVHGKACRTARLTQLEARLFEYLIQPLGFNLLANAPATGYQPCRHVIGLFLAAHVIGEDPEVLDTPVGTTAKEHVVDHFSFQALAGRKAHVVERPLERDLSGFVNFLQRGYGAI